MIKPMLCTLVDEPFDQKGWIFEPKWDGYRAIAEVSKGKILLYSRNQISFNQAYPQIVEELKRLPVDSVILDGEIIVEESPGKQSFQVMQNYGRSPKGKVLYYVFDILKLNGEDLRSLRLIERKKLLKAILLPRSRIRYTPAVKTKGIAFFKKAEKKGLEGIVAKDESSPYLMSRTMYWRKIKTHQRQEVVIIGFTEPLGARKGFGALLLGVYEKGALQFIGKVGGGFSHATLRDVYQQLLPLVQSKCPLDSPPKIKATWVKPKLVCEVSFAEWTQGGKLRQPIFKGMREDKAAKTVKRERVKNG